MPSVCVTLVSCNSLATGLLPPIWLGPDSPPRGRLLGRNGVPIPPAHPHSGQYHARMEADGQAPWLGAARVHCRRPYEWPLLAATILGPLRPTRASLGVTIDWKRPLTFILPGDAYLCSSDSWTQLSIALLNHGTRGRTKRVFVGDWVAHVWGQGHNCTSIKIALLCSTLCPRFTPPPPHRESSSPPGAQIMRHGGYACHWICFV